jgi:hypothetical protein
MGLTSGKKAQTPEVSGCAHAHVLTRPLKKFASLCTVVHVPTPHATEEFEFTEEKKLNQIENQHYPLYFCI